MVALKNVSTGNDSSRLFVARKATINKLGPDADLIIVYDVTYTAQVDVQIIARLKYPKWVYPYPLNGLVMEPSPDGRHLLYNVTGFRDSKGNCDIGNRLIHVWSDNTVSI